MNDPARLMTSWAWYPVEPSLRLRGTIVPISGGSVVGTAWASSVLRRSTGRTKKGRKWLKKSYNRKLRNIPK